MRRLVLIPIALIAGLGGCSRRDAAPAVTHAWVRLPAVSGQAAAAYFTVHGGSGVETLVKVESTLAQRAEMHESMAGMRGMTTMAPLAVVEVPASGIVAFAPGARHVMLFGLDKAITPGTAVPLRFGFKGGKTAEAEAKTVAAGEEAPY